jgi:hypothetical protein
MAPRSSTPKGVNNNKSAEPIDMPFAIGIIAIVLVLYYFASRGDSAIEEHAESGEEELLQLCLGNREQAARLVSLEEQRAPGIERREAVRRAVRSLRRDSR